MTTLTDGDFIVDLTAGGRAGGQAPDQEVPLDSVEDVARVPGACSTAAATNLVGVPHTFTATVQQTDVADPADSDWVAVPDGTTLTADARGRRDDQIRRRRA